MRSLSVLSLALFALYSCNQSNRWKKECEDLHQRSLSLEQRHRQLNASTDSLWDVTSTRLAELMPAGFPAIDRDIFLKARNAYHMRMFQSFNQLNAEAQRLIEEAGKYDEVLSAQMHLLLEQRQEFDRQKMQFLREVEKQDAAASRTYANELRTSEANQ